MMENASHTVKNSWNQWSDTWYRKYRTDEAIAKIIERPESAFHPVVFAHIAKMLPSLRGKRVCVPSSGDNHAVFAFHLMGAQVTSCDISERQLENSADIARQHGWDIEFVCDDTMQLSKIGSGEFDFVYTSNGVHVWIHDLGSMYRNIQRILKSGGVYAMFDIHPFMRPLTVDAGHLRVVKPYDSTGPFGEVPTYQWRVQDIVNAVISAGLTVGHMEETFAEDGTFWVDESKDEEAGLSEEEFAKYGDWRSNPMAAIPQWLSLFASK